MGIERSGGFEIAMKEEADVWLILGLIFAIRERFRDHNPVPIRGAVWVYSTRIMIYGYWYEIVSNMNRKQVVQCCYLFPYSRFGLGWCVLCYLPMLVCTARAPMHSG